MGREAIESVDPQAYVNIGGGQRPGWGGYDYARITKALTAIEPYDIGNNVEIIRSLNPRCRWSRPHSRPGPGKSSESGVNFSTDIADSSSGTRSTSLLAKTASPAREASKRAVLQRDPRRHRSTDYQQQACDEPIAIHYSQASMRTEWMLARRPEGDKWMERNARIERTDDEFLRLRESWCQMIEDQGMQYRFVSYDQVENNELLRGGYRVLVLPRSSSLSSAEVNAIREFVSQGGTVIADGMPGTFNEHSRGLPESPLGDMFDACAIAAGHDQTHRCRAKPSR